MAEQDPKPKTVIVDPSDHRPEMVDWAPEDRYAPVDPEPVRLDPRDVAALAIGVAAFVGLLAVIGAVVSAWLGVL